MERSTTSFTARLESRMAALQNCLCVGIDPDPRRVPQRLGSGVEGAERIAGLLIESAARHAAAVKFNLAFFEAFGSAGIAALERLRVRIPAELLVVMDAKRADIGSTAARQATALFDALGADAITVSPYLGAEAIEPLLERTDRFAYVLCRTSNPGAGELQDLVVNGDGTQTAPREPLYLRVARIARNWNERFGTVGLVVGATGPEEMARIRAVAPELPFLVPGIGAQGGDLAATLDHGPVDATTGIGPALLVNVGRGITTPAERDADPAAAIDRATAEWAATLRVLA